MFHKDVPVVDVGNAVMSAVVCLGCLRFEIPGIGKCGWKVKFRESIYVCKNKCNGTVNSNDVPTNGIISVNVQNINSASKKN